jgi:hypothetical protein
MARVVFLMDKRLYKIILKFTRKFIKLILGYSDEDAYSGPVFLHLDCYNYEGIYMGDSSLVNLVVKKMVPSRDIYFFFTVDSEPLFSILLPVFKNSNNFKIIVISYNNNLRVQK